MSSVKTPSYYLDTSFILKLFHFNESDSDRLLQKFANGNRYASFLTLIEFNTGFMGTVLKYRRLILELKDVAQATSELSDSFGPRPSKNGLILISILMRLQATLNTSDYLEFVDMLDVAIIGMHARMTRMVKGFIGVYAKHKSSIQVINSSDDFTLFTPINTRDARPDLTDIWTAYYTDIVRFHDQIETTELTRRLLKAEKDLIDLSDTIISNPFIKVSHIHKNDFAIALQCPNTYEIVAFDNIFKEITTYADKRGGYVAVPSRPSAII